MSPIPSVVRQQIFNIAQQVKFPDKTLVEVEIWENAKQGHAVAVLKFYPPQTDHIGLNNSVSNCSQLKNKNEFNEGLKQITEGYRQSDIYRSAVKTHGKVAAELKANAMASCYANIVFAMHLWRGHGTSSDKVEALKRLSLINTDFSYFAPVIAKAVAKVLLAMRKEGDDYIISDTAFDAFQQTCHSAKGARAKCIAKDVVKMFDDCVVQGASTY